MTVRKVRVRSESCELKDLNINLKTLTMCYLNDKETQVGRKIEYDSMDCIQNTLALT